MEKLSFARLNKLPKVDLYLHLESELMFVFARRNQVTIPF